MVGLGEERDEVLDASAQSAARAPTSSPWASTCGRRPTTCRCVRYYTPEEFARIERVRAWRWAIAHVESGPLVRSSYHADEQVGVCRDGFASQDAPPADPAHHQPGSPSKKSKLTRIGSPGLEHGEVEVHLRAAQAQVHELGGGRNQAPRR